MLIAQAPVPVPQPVAGVWKIVPRAPKGFDAFKGSFRLSGTTVSGLKGTTQKDLNSGCAKRVTVTMSGSVKMRHKGTAPGDDWEASPTRGDFFAVHLTLKKQVARKAKTEKTKGQLRIYFEGQPDPTGSAIYSSLSYESKLGGTCNLTFAVTPPA